jgi:hypothetical protein
MYKLHRLYDLVIVFFVFGMMMERVVAGDCDGSRCGCYKSYCWAYADGLHANPGDWWCYTQNEGVTGKQALWEECSSDADCYWDRTRGDCRQYKGDEVEKQDIC